MWAVWLVVNASVAFSTRQFHLEATASGGPSARFAISAPTRPSAIPPAPASDPRSSDCTAVFGGVPAFCGDPLKTGFTGGPERDATEAAGMIDPPLFGASPAAAQAALAPFSTQKTPISGISAPFTDDLCLVPDSQKQVVTRKRAKKRVIGTNIHIVGFLGTLSHEDFPNAIPGDAAMGGFNRLEGAQENR